MNSKIFLEHLEQSKQVFEDLIKLDPLKRMHYDFYAQSLEIYLDLFRIECEQEQGQEKEPTCYHNFFK